MTSHRTLVSLGEVLRVHHGYAFSSDDCRPARPDSKFPRLIRIGDFARTAQPDFKPERVQEFIGEYPERFRLASGDLIMAMTCQSSDGEILGVCMRVPSDGMSYLHNQRIGKVEITDASRLDSGFLEYAFRAASFRRHLFDTASGSKILHTAPERILQYKIPLPPLSEQRSIAAVLASLDDLIHCNQALVRKLEALRNAVVGRALQDAQEAVPLSQLATFANGRNFTKGASNTGRPVIRTPEIRRGTTDGTIRNDVDARADNIAKAGDILFVWSGSLLVSRWLHEEGLVNQHIFKVVPREGVPDWLVFGQIEYQMKWFLQLAADKATTMGHIQREHLDAPVPMPAPREIERLDAQVRPLWDQELALDLESAQLRCTRDELLPHLLAGRIKAGVEPE
jgi:type I restriction enzyme S subunit